jgi:hypothetical protein
VSSARTHSPELMDGEKAEILRGQLRDVAEGGFVYVWHFAKRQFLFVKLEEAFDLCGSGQASIQDDQVEGDDFPPPRTRPKGHIGTIREPKRRRLYILTYALLGDDAMNCHDDDWPG